MREPLFTEQHLRRILDFINKKALERTSTLDNIHLESSIHRNIYKGLISTEKLLVELLSVTLDNVFREVLFTEIIIFIHKFLESFREDFNLQKDFIHRGFLSVEYLFRWLVFLYIDEFIKKLYSQNILKPFFGSFGSRSSERVYILTRISSCRTSTYVYRRYRDAFFSGRYCKEFIKLYIRGLLFPDDFYGSLTGLPSTDVPLKDLHPQNDS